MTVRVGKGGNVQRRLLLVGFPPLSHFWSSGRKLAMCTQTSGGRSSALVEWRASMAGCQPQSPPRL